VQGRDGTECRRDVDVRLQSELRQQGLDAGVLPEGLDERADRKPATEPKEKIIELTVKYF